MDFKPKRQDFSNLVSTVLTTLEIVKTDEAVKKLIKTQLWDYFNSKINPFTSEAENDTNK